MINLIWIPFLLGAGPGNPAIPTRLPPLTQDVAISGQQDTDTRSHPHIASGPLPDPYLYRDQKIANDMSNAVADALVDWDYARFYKATRAMVDQLHYKDMYSDLLVDAAFSVGDRKLARATATETLDRIERAEVRMSRPPLVNLFRDRLYLQLTVIDAEEGLDLSGRYDRCKKLFDQSWNPAFDRDRPYAESLSPSRPTDVGVLACLALAGVTVREAISSVYLDEALKLDPRNVLAADELVDKCTAVLRYSGVRRVCQLMMSNLPKGEARDRFAATLAATAHLKDWKPTPRSSGTAIHP